MSTVETSKLWKKRNVFLASTPVCQYWEDNVWCKGDSYGSAIFSCHHFINMRLQIHKVFSIDC